MKRKILRKLIKIEEACLNKNKETLSKLLKELLSRLNISEYININGMVWELLNGYYFLECIPIAIENNALRPIDKDKYNKLYNEIAKRGRYE